MDAEVHSIVSLSLNEDVTSIIEEYADGYYFRNMNVHLFNVMPKAKLQEALQAQLKGDSHYHWQPPSLYIIDHGNDSANHGIMHVDFYWSPYDDEEADYDYYNERDDDVQCVLEEMLTEVCMVSELLTKIEKTKDGLEQMTLKLDHRAVLKGWGFD